MREHDLIHEIELSLFSAHFKAGFLSCIMAMKVFVAPASRNRVGFLDKTRLLKKRLDEVQDELISIQKRIDQVNLKNETHAR